MFHCLVCLKELDIVNVTSHGDGDEKCIVVDLECKTCPIITLTVHLAHVSQFRHLLDR